MALRRNLPGFYPQQAAVPRSPFTPGIAPPAADPQQSFWQQMFSPGPQTVTPGQPGAHQGGLLPFSPQQQGLLGMAGALMEAGGPSFTPTSLGQGFGRGLTAMQGAQGRAEQVAMQRQAHNMQVAVMQADLDRKARIAESFGAGGGGRRQTPRGSLAGGVQMASADGNTAGMDGAPSIATNPQFQQTASSLIQFGMDPDEALKVAATNTRPRNRPTAKDRFGRLIYTDNGEVLDPTAPAEHQPESASSFFNDAERFYPDDATAQQDGFATVREARMNYVTRQRKALGGVTPIQKGMTKEQEALASGRATQYTGIQAKAEEARNRLATLETLRGIDADTGAVEPALLWLREYGQGLGLPDALIGETEGIASQQAYQAVAGKMLAEALAAQVGPQTDRDADRLMQTLPSLRNLPDTNRFLINSEKALAGLAVERERFYDQWAEDNDGSLKGASKAWGAYRRKTPIVGVNPKSKLPVFFFQFQDYMRKVNPDIGNEELMELWSQKYG